jgi:hypothetical protein
MDFQHLGKAKALVEVPATRVGGRVHLVAKAIARREAAETCKRSRGPR